MGYDPLLADVMEQPDQGRKWMIFRAKKQDSIYVEEKEDVLNPFVQEVPPSRCSPSYTGGVVRNYAEYKMLTSKLMSFVTEDDATTTFGATQFNFRDKAGYGNLNTANSNLIRKFFNHTMGEVVLIRAICVTHTVGILPFQAPVFTQAFREALHHSNQAAIDKNFDNRKEVFSKFIRTFGTHFASTTQFGYATYFGKLFATQAKTPAEEAARRQCMLDSASEALTSRVPRGCETTAQHFSRLVADKCQADEGDVLVSETGSVSVNEEGDCDFTANEAPRPVAYVLEKIPSFFRKSWFSFLTIELETSQVSLNGAALSAYFDEFLGEYSEDVIKKAETPATHLCP